MFHVCVQIFDVTEILEVWRELNTANVLRVVGTFESVGKSELQNAGKAGLVTVQGKISAVLGTVLISKMTGTIFIWDKYVMIINLSYASFIYRCLPFHHIVPWPGWKAFWLGWNQIVIRIVSLFMHFGTPLGDSCSHCKVWDSSWFQAQCVRAIFTILHI